MLVLHFDYTSPASLPAALRCLRLADEGLRVELHGIDVLGVAAPLPVTLDQLAELERHSAAAAAEALEPRRPSRRPPSLRAHLLDELADAHGVGSRWRRGVLRAYWHDDADLDDVATLAGIAAEVGVPAHEAERWARDERALVARRQAQATLRGRGLGGVPVLELDGELVPADLAEDDLRRLASL